MAWISVHEQVIGGKLRCLAKELDSSQNEALGILITLWLWGINNADREGRIVGADKEDVAKALVVGIDKRLNPNDAVEALIRTHWIDVENDGLFLHDWEEWQEQWYKAIKRREDDKERKRKSRAEAKAVKQEAPQEEPNPTKPQPKVEKPKAEGYSKDFEDFWEVYPRKVGKGDAYKKYQTRIKDGWSPAELLRAAKAYRTKVINEHTEQQYIKHPKTFLSDTTPFVDYIRTEAPKKMGNDDDPYAEWRN